MKKSCDRDRKMIYSPIYRSRIIKEIMKFGRTFPKHKKFIFHHVDFHKFFNAVENIHEWFPSPYNIEIAKEWIEIAEEDLQAYRRLYGSEDGPALYHLQQCIEKLFKSLLILMGLKEEEIIQYGHKPQRFLNKLLDDERFVEILGEDMPFKIVNMPKVDEEGIKNLKDEINKNGKYETIEEGDRKINDIIRVIEILSSYNLTELGKDIFNKYREEFSSEARKLEKLIKTFDSDLSLEDTIFTLTEYNWVIIWFTVILLPLLICAWPFESVTRYPDERRKLKRNITDYAFYYHSRKIEAFLWNYIEVFRNVLSSKFFRKILSMDK